MSRKYKRILSLVLALIMICSAMGVMAFAADDEHPPLDAWCTKCEGGEGAQRTFIFLRHEEEFNRIIDCPKHPEMHDAEEWYTRDVYVSTGCAHLLEFNQKKVYICLR